MNRIHVGMSGWTYAPWRGKFYPKGLAQKKELAHASRQVNSIEINGTFYGLQKPASFQQWYAETPEGFVFAVKGTQYITHVKRLKDVREPLATFLGSGVLCLEEKLGPILWQFPPNVMLKDDRFERFFELLPRDTKSAARLAINHGYKKEGRVWTDVTENRPLRHAFEFRHPSFFNQGFLDRMRAHGLAYVISHAAEKSVYTEDLTADFVYVRMHGEGRAFKKGYPDSELRAWAGKLRGWASGSEPREVFLYFSTEQKIFAPSDALRLTALVDKI